MAWGKCYDCGNEGYIENHHVVGREIDPDNIVPLCKECHHYTHHGIFVIRDNAASRKFREWRDGRAAQHVYIRRSDIYKKLKELGYVPMPDGWENWDEADVIRQELIEEGWLDE